MNWLVTITYPNAAHNRTETFANTYAPSDAESEAYNFFQSFLDETPEDVTGVYLIYLDGFTAQVIRSHGFKVAA